MVCLHQISLLTQWKWKCTSRGAEVKKKKKRDSSLIWLNKLPLKVVVAVIVVFDPHTFLLPCPGVVYQGASNDFIKTSVRMESRS